MIQTTEESIDNFVHKIFCAILRLLNNGLKKINTLINYFSTHLVISLVLKMGH